MPRYWLQSGSFTYEDTPARLAATEASLSQAYRDNLEVLGQVALFCGALLV